MLSNCELKSVQNCQQKDRYRASARAYLLYCAVNAISELHVQYPKGITSLCWTTVVPPAPPSPPSHPPEPLLRNLTLTLSASHSTAFLIGILSGGGGGGWGLHNIPASYTLYGKLTAGSLSVRVDWDRIKKKRDTRYLHVNNRLQCIIFTGWWPDEAVARELEWDADSGSLASQVPNILV